MADDKTPETDDLAPDDLDTVAGGTGHGNATEGVSTGCHATYCSGTLEKNETQ